LSAYVEKRGELGWVVGCSLGGERWDGEEEGEIEEESVGRVGIFFTVTDGITDRHVPSVYPSVIPPVKVSRHYMKIPV
jgi:hypothetical protein